MNNTTNDIEIIERYFDNELSAQETAYLKDRLKADPELKKLFEQEKLLVNIIRFKGAENNLKFLEQLEKSLSQENTSHLRKHWYYYAAAACITLFAIAGVLLPISRQTPAELYADYFVPYPNVFEPTLRSEATIDQRSEAFQAYEQGDYDRSAELFTALIKVNKEPGMLLLLGNANLMLGKTEAAKQNFNELISDFDDLDMQAKWFLSLCYLRTGEMEQARNLLKELGDTEISYATKAKELLKKVD